MKRCIAILLALLLLSACGTAAQPSASEPESDPAPIPEPASASASPEPEPEPDPMPDLRPGRVLSFWDAQGLTPDYPVQSVKGTQAELDRWNAAVRDPAIARMDFTDMRQETAELPVEQEQEILTAMRDADIRLYEGNPDPSTGGGCSVAVYDGEDNLLFDMSYVGDYFSVWFAGEDVIYYFDGEGTTLDTLLTSDYGVPGESVSAPGSSSDLEGPVSSSQSEEVPDLGPWENPDTSLMGDDVLKAQERSTALCAALQQPFDTQLSRGSYSYYCTYHIGNQVILEIGVIDDAAVEAFLASWTGEKWDKLDKKQGKVSRTKQIEFIERAKQLDWTPVEFYVESDPGTTINGLGEQNLIYCSIHLPENAPAGEAANWQKMPQPLKDLMKELGIPEDMVSYHGPRYTPPGANPNT